MPCTALSLLASASANSIDGETPSVRRRHRPTHERPVESQLPSVSFPCAAVKCVMSSAPIRLIGRAVEFGQPCRFPFRILAAGVTELRATIGVVTEPPGARVFQCRVPVVETCAHRGPSDHVALFRAARLAGAARHRHARAPPRMSMPIAPPVQQPHCVTSTATTQPPGRRRLARISKAGASGVLSTKDDAGRSYNSRVTARGARIAPLVVVPVTSRPLWVVCTAMHEGCNLVQTV
jgi:hypothetical protein